MSDLDDLFKQLAEAKANDPVYQKDKKLEETIKESVKVDLGGLFSQISAVKAVDPVAQKTKRLEKEVKESAKADLGSLFAELTSLKKQKAELVESNPELAEVVEEPAPEIIAEEIPLPTPIGVVPPEAQAPDIDKYIKAAKEQDATLYAKEFKTVNGKIKFLEQWIAKIQSAGPGGGEVNFRYLDDVDRSTIVDGNFLTFNADTKKFEFRPVTGGGTTGSFNPLDVKAVYAQVKNADSVTIHKGDPVYLYRATGNMASVIQAGSNVEDTSAKTLGLAYSDFAPGQTGIIITKGTLTGVDTSAYTEGDTLYLGSTVGTLTNVKPHSPNHLVYIGVVERANQGQGQIYVSPQNGYELEELHNVNINHLTVLADGHYLRWSAANNQWVNAPFPELFSGSYADLTNKPTLFSGSYNSLTDKPVLFSGAYADLSGKPTLFSGSYTDLTNKPTLFSGSYTDLTNKPTIPSLTGYATETYVTTAITNLIGAAPAALDTLKEIADKLASDESVVSSLTTTVADKVSLSGSYANPSWITSLAGSKVTNAVLTTDMGTVTNAMLAGSIANAKLVNSVVTIGTTQIALGTTATNLDGLNLVTSTSFAGALLGNASTATKLATSRNINGVAFDGTSAITIKASTTSALTIGTGLSGTSFDGSGAVTITNTGVLSVNGNTGAITGVVTTADTGTVTNTMLAGSIANAKLANSSININGTNITLGDTATVTAAAGTLTGTGLPSAVVNSNLQSVGQLNNLQVSGGASVTNNTATDHYANWGTVGQIFDDGNFHIHAKTGNLWLNALGSGDINLGTQYNSGSGSNVYVGKDLISKTAYKARTNWNAPINTEITLDNYRYRVANSGGIFPQVLGNISGQTVNSSWVSVATCSGTSITQTGNTGALLPNNSWTNLYSNHGLDAPADMVVTTITDKAHGIVHRVTFIRNDDGSTTGYSIFAEKLW